MREYMDNIFIYSLLDAPAPPAWILERAQAARADDVPNQVTMNNWGDDFVHRPLYKDGKTYRNSFNISVFLDDECLSWARTNITKSAKDIRSTITRPGLERCGAHIDRTRNYTLMYLLEDGGDDHSTVFYREKGTDELVRPREYHVDDYDQLDEIKRVKLKLNSWNLVQARVLHSIENISNGRVSIQISLDNMPDDLLLVDPVFLNYEK